MKITLLLLIVGVCLVSAKYLPYESDDSNGILLRNKRSDSGESDSSAEQTDKSGDDSDDDNSVEKKHREREDKRHNKEEKSRRKVLEREEKERRREEEHRRKEEEHQRKLEEKHAKEEQKEQERKDKDERKRHEKLEKEKRKQEELQNKAEEKRLKEEKKKQEKQLNELKKEALEPESQDDGFLETEEEHSVELEDVWRNHIYTKYGLTFSSSRLEKQAALNKYIQEELGLQPNSTKSERRRAILNLIQTKLQNDAAEKEAIRKQVLSHVNAVTLQKLRNDLEKDIEEINNKTNLLKNVSSPWAVPVQETLEEKRTFLQALSQFLANIIPNWISGNQSQPGKPGAQINENGNQNIGSTDNVPSTSEISETSNVGSTNEDISNDFITPDGSSVNAAVPENEETGTNNDVTGGSLVNQSVIGNNDAASQSNTAENKPVASGDEIIISNTNPTLPGNGNVISDPDTVDVSEGSSVSQGNEDTPSLENDQSLSSNISNEPTNGNAGANGNEPPVSNTDGISNSQINQSVIENNDAVSQDNTSDNKPVAGDENNAENIKPVLEGNDNVVTGINSEDVSEGSSVSQVNIDIDSPSNDQAVPVSTVSSETINNSNLNNPALTESNNNINANENQVTVNNNGVQSVTEDNVENASNTLEIESGTSNVQNSANSKPVVQESGTNLGDESEGSGNNLQGILPSLVNDQSVSSDSSAISNGNVESPTQSSSSSSTIASSGINQDSSDGNNLENPSSNKDTSNVVVDQNQGSMVNNGVSTNLPVDPSLVSIDDTISEDKKPSITNENKPVVEEDVSVGSTGTLGNPSTENTILSESESSSVNNGVENIPSLGSNTQNNGNLVENGIDESETAIKPTENLDAAAPTESDLNSQWGVADEVTSTKDVENNAASATESVILNKNDSVIIPNDSQSQANSITSNNNAVEESLTPIDETAGNLTGDSNKESSTVVSEILSTTVTSEIDATTDVAGAIHPIELVSKEPAPVDEVQTISDQSNGNGITNTESESTSKDSYVTATPEQSGTDITVTSNDGSTNIANVETQTASIGDINESVSSTDAPPVDVQSEQSTTIVEQGNNEVPEMGTTETVAYTPVNVAEDFTVVAEAGATVVDIVIQ